MTTGYGEIQSVHTKFTTKITQAMAETVHIILLILCITATSLASNDANNITTLSDYLRVASLNNPELKAKFEDWRASLAQIPQAKSLDDPKFTYGYFVEQDDALNKQKFSIAQTFPWFGKIQARSDAASAKANAAQQRYQAAKLELFYKVKTNFYEYVFLKTSIDIASENLQLIQHFEEVARIKYRTDTASHPDIIRAQIELAKFQDVLKSLQELRTPTVAGLNAIINQPYDSNLPWPEKQPVKAIEMLSREGLINLLLEFNPQLAEINWEIEAARSDIELAKKRFYPDMDIGVEWLQNEMPRNKDEVMLMFSVNIPLWQENYKAGEMQAKSMLRKNQHEKNAVANNQITIAIETLYDIEDSQRKIVLYGESLLPKAQQLLNASEEAYKSGSVDFLSLIDAQRTLLEYSLELERATSNYQQKIAQLESIIGREL
jgi:outer membrane protein TolC